MSIILKLTLKHIFKKPLRLILMVFCLFSCTFAALLSFDMSGALDAMIRQMVGSQVGKVEIFLHGDDRCEEALTDPNLPEGDHINLYSFENVFYKDLKDQYTYVHKEKIYITGLDFSKARELELIDFEDDIKDGEVVVGKKLADWFDYKEGDTISLYDQIFQYHDFKIAKIVEFPEDNMFGGYDILMNENTVLTLTLEEKVTDGWIHVNDDSKCKEAYDYLKETYPNLTIECALADDNVEMIFNIIEKLMFSLFAISILMVIFVAISVSERIISERMAVVGTLRSVGVSGGTTTFILLLENACYGIIGSLVGCGIYSLVRQALLTVLIGNKDTINSFGEVSPWLYLMVILMAIVVVCLIPLKEVLKASNTPIRDLIFANKDTEYRFSKVGTIAGIACVIGAVVIAFAPKSFYLSFLQLGLIVFALSLLFPYIQFAVGKLLYMLFDKLDKPILKMAATEVYTKKSTIGSSVLVTTALALVLVVNLVGTAIKDVIISDNFTSTNYVELSGGHDTNFYRCFENIESVTDVEYIHVWGGEFKINGVVNKNTKIIGIPEGGFKYFVVADGAVPLAEDEISLGKVVAEKNNVKVGDEIEVIFRSDKYYPITKNLKVKSLCDFSTRDISGLDIIINEDLLKDIFGDQPYTVNIQADDPEKVDEFIEENMGDSIIKSYTVEQYHEDARKADFGFDAMITGIMIFGTIVTFVGAVSSLLIGFEGRKRECAVLCSTSMPRKKLNRMLFTESFIASGIAVLCAIPAGILMMYPLKVAFSTMQMQLRLITGISSFVYIIIIMWAVFALSSIFPMRALKKMNLAEQLKYE